MVAVIVDRPGNAEIAPEQRQGFVSIHSFDEVETPAALAAADSAKCRHPTDAASDAAHETGAKQSKRE